MRIKTIEVLMGRTVNLGNYESARFDVSVSAELDSSDDPRKVYTDLYDTVKARIFDEVSRIHKHDLIQD